MMHWWHFPTLVTILEFHRIMCFITVTVQWQEKVIWTSKESHPVIQEVHRKPITSHIKTKKTISLYCLSAVQCPSRTLNIIVIVIIITSTFTHCWNCIFGILQISRWALYGHVMHFFSVSGLFRLNSTEFIPSLHTFQHTSYYLTPNV